ncbi:CsiV family protein [Aliiglaciecola sp. M165]|uniref:CsiV family protein n=1 Tax=Aliiglaciecola sp. M165 TaxID=2593649 RepID=UPI001180E2C3|nr:CsiV family protein [Aliiglaciecola sp. M165]TRY32593.1 hypothetical protein FM019_07080 [Aliiglaciecola sp. M165]
MKIFNKNLFRLKHISFCNVSRLCWVGLLTFVALTSMQSNAQEREWWFDIEVIVYKRNISPSEVMENFAPKLRLVDTQMSIPLLREYVQPDLNYLYQSLPLCFAPAKEIRPIQAIPEFDLALAPAPDLSVLDDLMQLDSNENDRFVEQQDISENVQAEQMVREALAPTTVLSGEAADGIAESKTAALSVWIDSIYLTEFTTPDPILCRFENETAPTLFVEKVPTLVTEREWPLQKHPQLLSSESLQLSDFARDINRQRGLSLMSHFAWRQQVFFGQENATPLHLIAGENFADRFVADGTLKPKKSEKSDDYVALDTVQQNSAEDISKELENEAPPLTPSNAFSLVDKIREALANEQFQYDPDDYQVSELDNVAELESLNDKHSDSQKVQEHDLWELDGNLTVFLRYIQRTPYLHIDGDLDFRSPVFDQPLYLQNQPDDSAVEMPGLKEPDRLQSFPFQQLRRVISKQIHYFDHPMFGLIVQIRRYDFPEPAKSEQQQ